MVEKYYYNDFLMLFWREEKMKIIREDTRMDKLECFQNYPFWTYIRRKKINTFTFWCKLIPLDPHWIYTY